MKKTRRQIAREKAAIGIYQYLLVDASLEDIEEYILNDETVKESEETYQFCKELIDTTILHLPQYQEEIKKHLKKGWTLQRLSYMEQAILLIATCELLDMDQEKTIAINEAVLLAKEYCDDDSYKFINGVLHSII